MGRRGLREADGGEERGGRGGGVSDRGFGRPCSRRDWVGYVVASCSQTWLMPTMHTLHFMQDSRFSSTFTR